MLFFYRKVLRIPKNYLFEEQYNVISNVKRNIIYEFTRNHSISEDMF